MFQKFIFDLIPKFLIKHPGYCSTFFWSANKNVRENLNWSFVKLFHKYFVDVIFEFFPFTKCCNTQIVKLLLFRRESFGLKYICFKLKSIIVSLLFIFYDSKSMIHWLELGQILLTRNFLWRRMWRCLPLKNIKSVTEIKSKNGIRGRIEKKRYEFYSEIVNISFFPFMNFSYLITDNDVIIFNIPLV